MSAPAQTRRTGVAGPLAAVALVGAIGCLAAEVFPSIRGELRLRRAEKLIAQNPIRGFEALERETSTEGLSRRQRERGAELATEAVARVRGGHPMLKMVGGRAFNPASCSKPYVTPSREMMLLFDVPEGLPDLGARIRVLQGVREVCEVSLIGDGRQGRAEVPLPVGGTAVVDVDLVIPVGVYGTVTSDIVRNLQLVQTTRGPTVRLRSGTGVHELKEGAPLMLQVERGAPLLVELKDELGLSELQWSVDGLSYDPFDWLEEVEAQTKTAQLPAELTASASHARALELRASNSYGLTTKGVVRLFVRDPGAHAIEQARVAKVDLRDGQTVHAGEKALAVSVVLAKGENPEDLLVTWDDRPVKTHVNDREVSALLETDAEGARNLALVLRKAPILKSTVRFDWTPPTVRALLDPSRQERELEVRREVHDVPIGSIVGFAISDFVGLDRELTTVTIEGAGLEETGAADPTAAEGDSARNWMRCFRCGRTGVARVTVVASDTARNRSTTHEYRLRIADPMEGRTVTLNGAPFTSGATIFSNQTHFTVKTQGGIDVDGLTFSLLDPDQKHAALGQVVLQRCEVSGTLAGSLDAPSLTTSGRRVPAILSRHERALVKGEVVVDFVGPAFRVLILEQAGLHDGTPRFFAAPGQRISVTITDAAGVDMSSISAVQGADIDHVIPGGPEAGAVLLLPVVIEEPVVLEATDVAGNRAAFRFEVAAKPDSRPVPPPPPGNDPPRAESAPRLDELLANPKIVHGALGTFFLVPVRDPRVAPFYFGEHEVTVKEWRAFVAALQSQSASAGGEARVARQQTITTEAVRLLTRNTKVLSKIDDDPLPGVTLELAKAYAAWANIVARDLGTWRLPTATQWVLAAGRASYPGAPYPTTANFPNGSDLTNEGVGGALFGRDFLVVQEMPRRTLAAGAFGLRGMPGSLFEWIIDGHGGYSLIGGSAVSPKEACRLDAPLRSGVEVADYERGLRLVLIPRAR